MPVETKVTAATVASTLTGLIVMLLGTIAFGGGAVPALIVSVVGALVTGAVTFGAGWVARHTPRPLDADTGSTATLTAEPPASASSATSPVDLPAAPPSTPAAPTTPPTTPPGIT